MEKKTVVYDLRLSYTGPLSLEEFYSEVEDWIKEKGMQRDLKKKMEHITPKGKEIEWTIEAWKDVSQFARDVVRLRALFHNVKEIDIKRKGHNIRLNQVEALFIFDGFLEQDTEHRWEQTPWFFFLRAMFDKYIYKFWSERFFDDVYADTHDLQKRIKAFLSLYKYKVK